MLGLAWGGLAVAGLVIAGCGSGSGARCAAGATMALMTYLEEHGAREKP